MMTLTNLMFLFELGIKGVKSNINSKQFNIKCKFADLFELNLSDPYTLKQTNKKGKVKGRRKICFKENLRKVKNKLNYKKSVFLVNNAEWLMLNMKQYPIELSLWSKSEPEYKIGTTYIPWSNTYIDYLNSLSKKKKKAVSVEGIYNIYDEISSNRLATITLSIKLTASEDKMTSQFKCDSEFNSIKIDSHDIFNPEPSTHVFKTNKQCCCCNGIIKNEKNNTTAKEKDKSVKYLPNYNIIDDKNIKSIELTNNSNSMDCKRKYNLLDYVFANPTAPNPKKIYCVYYFTVENDGKSSINSNSTSKSQLSPENPPSSEKTNVQRKHIRIKKCDSECVNIKTNFSKSPSTISIDFPQELADVIRIDKCKSVRCDHKVHRELPAPYDDAILLDLTNLERECCKQYVEKVEEVVGDVSAQVGFGKDPCFCTCECKFGFTKKTRYCKICGGYETFGDELVRKPGHELPHPCPIFHHLAAPAGQPGKGKAQKSSDKKSIDSDKGLKKKDDRFKFNYGYKAPKIGHCHCTAPCKGTLGPVPKHMGWLWNAEDTPGMKVKHGWKPGAISKRLLDKLNKAKLKQSVVENTKQIKRIKKRLEDKPTLIVTKVNGQYQVVMQASSNDVKDTNHYTPVTYKIESANNNENINKKLRLKKRLIKSTIKNRPDPYHPELCKKTCYESYKQAMHMWYDRWDSKYYEEDEDCSCADDASLSCNSSEIDWEIHFTPPFSTQKIKMESGMEMGHKM